MKVNQSFFAFNNRQNGFTDEGPIQIANGIAQLQALKSFNLIMW